jgi:hypothetical protein
MTRQVVDCFYAPYVSAIRRAERAVRDIDPAFSYRREYPAACTLREVFARPSAGVISAYLSRLKRTLRGRYNVYPDAYFTDEAHGSSG